MRILKSSLLLALSCIASAATAQQLASAPKTASPPALQQASAPAAAAPSSNFTSASTLSDYVIGPQDSLTVEVSGVPELSQTVQVDNGGNIPLPLLGFVPASGLTPSQLSQRIAGKLQGKYVKDPLVTVTVKDAASQKVTVDGSVTQPGVYQIPPHATLTQAVALAKGPDNVADIHTVSIIRTGPSGRVSQVYDLGAIHDGKAVDPPVQANDEIVVDASGTRKFVRDFGSVLGILTWMRP